MTPRRGFTLRDAGRVFWTHPSPWLLAGLFAAAVTARTALGDWQVTDALVPAAMLAVFPFFEWLIHVFVLHWRPKRLGPMTLDPLLARKHREHHSDPRAVSVIFIPTGAFVWVLPLTVGVALVAFPRIELGLTFLVIISGLGVAYEWCHYLIHSDYKPKTAVYRAIWRNHRQHHFKNENYWFTVTSSGTADRVLGTYPDPATVSSSPTVKNLHGAIAAR
jgi:hypothetical protein